jgi:hypothetical protein
MPKEVDSMRLEALTVFPLLLALGLALFAAAQSDNTTATPSPTPTATTDNSTMVTYAVTFYQSGIPIGVEWGVNLEGKYYSSMGPSVTVSGVRGVGVYRYGSPMSRYNLYSGVVEQYYCDSGDCVGFVSSAIEKKATFTATKYYKLTAVPTVPTQTNGGSVSYIIYGNGKSGMVIDGTGYWYPVGENVTISANAEQGYRFSSWTGTGTGSYTGSANPLTVMMNSPITEIAIFVAVSSAPTATPTPTPTPTLTATPNITDKSVPLEAKTDVVSPSQTYEIKTHIYDALGSANGQVLETTTQTSPTVGASSPDVAVTATPTPIYTATPTVATTPTPQITTIRMARGFGIASDYNVLVLAVKLLPNARGFGAMKFAGKR